MMNQDKFSIVFDFGECLSNRPLLFFTFWYFSLEMSIQELFLMVFKWWQTSVYFKNFLFIWKKSA